MATSHLQRAELVFGVVGATGTDLPSVCGALISRLTSVGYRTDNIRLIALIHEFSQWSNLPQEPEEQRIEKYMDAGDELRELTGRGDAIAILGCGAIREARKDITGSDTVPAPSQAYILRSLKHPHEVRTLRNIYGPNFYLIGAYSPRHSRVTHLAHTIAKSHNSGSIDTYRSIAEGLIQRDQEDTGKALGQQLRDTFPLADVFVDVDDQQGMEKAVSRFVDLIFGYPYHTPTKQEYGMFHAQAAALRSAALGRQVGATISTIDGDVVAVGTNEVPKAGGGLYWSDDEADKRDFRLGHDSIDRFKISMLSEIIDKLRQAGWFEPPRLDLSTRELVAQALDGPIRGAQLLNVLEYGRVVHAEMAAIVEAARRGVSVKGCTLYATTFPCHNCARHIVAAGIARVVYVEPYPKSLTTVLHTDAVTTDGNPPQGSQIPFESFVGIAPRRYMDLFEMPNRKKADGSTVDWDPLASAPRAVSEEATYLARETRALEALRSKIPPMLQ